MRRQRPETSDDKAQRPIPTDADFPKYSIAVASDLSGVPQQQLRRMEQSGLVAPARTEGKTRRYSDNDISDIAAISDLSDEGINMPGIRYILQLRQDIEALRAEVADLRQRLERVEGKPRNKAQSMPR
ncbi:MAG TPA: MerR family transcriptional regulator [Ktedonobacterales bacterium]|jgi:DNA-binding transcriptional MerR regulator|nr:MerR family transcriptional regulator [Ktedonobacterales bacterium]